MPPGCGVGITSLPRESSLPTLMNEVKKYHQNNTCIAKNSAAMAASKDILWQGKKPELFYNSYRHIDKVKKLQEKDPEFRIGLRPSMSCPNVSTITKSSAGGSTYMELLMKQYGQF
eukprot:gnl/MRDRNA2_/MRDRNA2_89712_c0_seq1.p1 gnl/MRDRNA2_/MRDRNA2_89712_c0~~gnl/MRDRNA2_/MRDRNA2_89712_c0_seq1.p1  ORF type:complete len:116 (+),score=13.42 gnl/MRDRNA2_/MRDRNA2_89712_c0_seq1:74-421(+)